MSSHLVRALASASALLSAAGVVTAQAAVEPGRPTEVAIAAPQAELPVAPVVSEADAGDVRVSASAVYNDAQRVRQWGMNALGAEAFHAKRTAKGIVVAVIDSGVQGNHPDLVGHLVQGYDFTTNRPGGAVDGYGHGTHVAGIVAASANNRTGVAGLAPEAKIMPLRVLDDDGAGWGSDVARALVYAADHGAKVANVSAASAYSARIADAVAYAQRKGVIVVAAVGNDRGAGNPVSYPAALPGVIGVSAEDSAMKNATFSNTGAYVDVTAPGVGIVSTYKGSAYVSMSGTSMAAPYVSATVAVLAAAKPGLTPAGALKAMQSTARDLGVKGFDRATGAGQVRPLQALCTLVRC